MRARCSTNSATPCTACCRTSPIRCSPAPASSTDFVELPSQLYEHWLSQPEILRRYATHYRTGEPIPEALLAAPDGGAQFQPGFRDGRISRLRLRRYRPAPPQRVDDLDIAAFEREYARDGSACRARSSCATARRISRMCSPATAIRPAITAISGRRCSTPMPSRPSRRPATLSIRQTAARLKRFIYSAGKPARSGRGLHGLPREASEACRPCWQKRGLLSPVTE